MVQRRHVDTEGILAKLSGMLFVIVDVGHVREIRAVRRESRLIVGPGASLDHLVPVHCFAVRKVGGTTIEDGFSLVLSLFFDRKLA